MVESMLESQVENRLKGDLEGFGFSVLKFITPGSTGTMDRLILRPTYAPGPPAVVEIKRPDKKPEPLQAAKARDWRLRGVDVRDPVSTYREVDALIVNLLREVLVHGVMPVKQQLRLINAIERKSA